ncbi:glycosyltransferase family 2 protein [Patescibacteria group bacterium]|nr:glycosyltransferase family 2 protein [Patescibacteria group bacterium]
MERNKIAILMSVRNEESYIGLNISYHLDLAFDYIFIADNCSTDGTKKILESYNNDPRVIVIEEKDPVFDHARIANRLLKYAKENYKIDWFIFLDTDEFLSIKEKDVHDFVARLEDNNIPYATIGWANALFDYTFKDYTCSPTHPIDTTKYFYPWPERDWQKYGHFRKAIVKNHDNMEVVVGGHYIRTENNPDFFGEYHWNPFIIPASEAKLLHFEFRGKASDIYDKWKKLAEFENDSTSSKNAPWMERIKTIKGYVTEFKDNIDEIKKRWFSEHRTFWGTIISDDKIVYDMTLVNWYGKYLRRRIEKGEIKSICLVRTGHLGDVVMTEPVARFLSKYVNNVSLATEIKEAGKLFDVYNKIYPFNDLVDGKIHADAIVRLVHERSDNKKTYIQGYMESVGFSDIKMDEIPILSELWSNIIEGEYALIAPCTSWWEEKKRNWGHDKFAKLKDLIEKELGIKCVVLEKDYSLSDMISLIKHCSFIVGNDSGPIVIAQSFNRKSFIIFGATHPKYLHLSKNVVSIYAKDRHKLCSHNSREEEIRCCEEFCMDRIRVSDVFNTVKINI